jgi:hypothetical protein
MTTIKKAREEELKIWEQKKWALAALLGIITLQEFLALTEIKCIECELLYRDRKEDGKKS